MGSAPLAPRASGRRVAVGQTDPLLSYSAGCSGHGAHLTALAPRRPDTIILAVFSVAAHIRTVVLLIIGIALSTTAEVALRGHSASRCVTAAGSVP
jgi:hypothetical protein